MAMALLEIPVSGCTCLSTADKLEPYIHESMEPHTLVYVGRVSLLSRLLATRFLVALRSHRSRLLRRLLGSFGTFGGLSWGLRRGGGRGFSSSGSRF